MVYRKRERERERGRVREKWTQIVYVENRVRCRNREISKVTNTKIEKKSE